MERGFAMRPRERRETSEQDLFRSRLNQIIDMNHALVKLARTIDWRFLGAEFGAGYTHKPGQPLEALPKPKNPIRKTLADCCARAASGHAAAPPRSVMKSRRLTAQCLPCFRPKGRISLRESLPIDEAGSRAEKTIRDICMNTPEKLTMWGFRKADPDAELKSVTPQAWQGLSINPLYGQPETDLKAVGRRREYGAATKGKYGPVIWTGLCFDRRQFVAASVTARGNGPPSLAPAAQPVPQQAPPSSSRRGRRARYDWDEAKIVLLDALKQRGDFDETDQENDW